MDDYWPADCDCWDVSKVESWDDTDIDHWGLLEMELCVCLLTDPWYWSQSDKPVEWYAKYIKKNYASFCGKHKYFWMRHYGFYPSNLEDLFLFGIRHDISSEMDNILKIRSAKKIEYPNIFKMTWQELVDTAQDAEAIITLRRNSDRTLFKPVFHFGYRNKGFPINNRGFVIVHADGACSGNGTANAKGGIGVWFGHNHVNNISETVSSEGNMNNSVAEITAVIRALEIVKDKGVEHVEVRLDAKNLITSLKSSIFSWVEKGWIKKNGDPLMHKDLFRRVLRLMIGMQIDWVRVKPEKNVEADVLAQQATK